MIFLRNWFVHFPLSIIGRLTNTVVLAPHPTTVGNTAEDILFGLIKAKKEGKKLLLLRPIQFPLFLRLKLTNMELFELESEWLYGSNSLPGVIGSLVLSIYSGFLRGLNYVCERTIGVQLSSKNLTPMYGQNVLWQNGGDTKEFSWNKVREMDWKNQLEFSPKVQISIKKALSCKYKLVELGVPENAWFVCLHVRESGYWDDQQTDGQYRNANITNYHLAIKAITDRGGWVVRMGDSTMTKLPAIEKVIDYPFTKYKNHLMDLYLIGQCEFYIGMQSGIFDVVTLFKRPMLLVNMTGWLFAYPPKRGDIGILKHMYCKEKNRYLSIEERLNASWHATSHQIPINKYNLKENSPEEICAVVEEYFDTSGMENKSDIQSMFDAMRIARGKSIIENVENFGKGEIGAGAGYRLASRLESSQGSIGKEFLTKNWQY